jgi:uncharacterized repeat protein (TIGR03843 family)
MMPADEPAAAACSDPTELDTDTIDEILAHGELELEGRLVVSSNVSFVGHVTLADLSLRCVYKPIAGERPLWDFPDGTLADRERAARVVSDLGGWGVVPPTVLRDGRFGRGMVQQWVDVVPDRVLVDVVPEEFDRPGWIAVLEAEDRYGTPVLLVHADDDRLRAMAVMDIVINNADRKGGHVLSDRTDRVWGCDHGIAFHQEVKLRTVLWGWAEEPLRDEDLEALRGLERALDTPAGAEVADLLSHGELVALRRRIARLLRQRVMPSPRGTWPAIPWPAI